MKVFRTAFLIGLVACVDGAAFASDGEHAVIDADHELNRLIQSNDSKSADSYYATPFVLTTSSGVRKSKTEILAQISSADLKLEVNETRDAEVRQVGNVAVLTGQLHQKGTWKETRFDTYLWVTDTWVWNGTRWVLLAGHASQVRD